MNAIMGNTLRLILVTFSLIYISHALRQSRHLYRNFQHEIIYPSKNFFETSINLDGQPTSISAGFSIKRPPFPPFPFRSINFFPPRSSSREFSPEYWFRGFQNPLRLPPLFPRTLFTPNSIDQRPETKGQMDEYKKDLEEQAKEAEMEFNSVTSDFSNIEGLDGTTKSNNYVSVKSHEYKYSYST